MKHKFRAWDTVREVMIPNVAVGDGFLWEIYPDGGGDELCPDTHIVMQAIGRQDDDGVEIYNGDILSNSFRDGYEGYTSFVFYRNQAWYLNTHNLFRPIGKKLGWSSISEERYGGVKVIGNIYENPELVKG